MRIAITGHRELDEQTRMSVHDKLVELVHRVARPGDEAWSGMAIGADQIFAEIALAAGLRLHAVVASGGYESTFAVGAERDAYERLISAASRVTILDFAAPSEEAFAAVGRLLVDECDVLLAVWDGKPARGLGGTGDVVDYARQRNRLVEVIAVER